MEWSKEQALIFKNKHKNMIINADAGSGKTTVLFELIKRIQPKNALMLSFNRDIADTNIARAKKMGITVNINTFHSYAYTTFPKKRKINTAKVWHIVDTYAKKVGFDFDGRNKLFSLATRLRGIGYVLNADSQYKTVDEIVRLFVSKSDLKKYGEHLKKIGDLCDKSYNIDFDDMCDYPIRYNYIKNESIDLLLVDELQDLNVQQLNIVRRIIEVNDCQFIGVGDSKQAIFGFRGAIDAIPSLSDLVEETYTLSTTYRCPSRVMKFVNTNIEASNGVSFNEGGVVKKIKGTSLEDILIGIMIHIPDVIISQKNSVLITVWATLFKQDIYSSLKGTPIIRGLFNLLSTIKTYNFNQFKRTLNAIVEDKDAERSELAKGLLNLIKILKVYDRHHLMEILEEMAEIDADLALETVHSFKGREAPVVAVICDWFTDNTDQIDNVKYVAYTRCLETLIVAKVL